MATPSTRSDALPEHTGNPGNPEPTARTGTPPGTPPDTQGGARGAAPTAPGTETAEE